jgi:hypothetical protein
MICHSEEVGMVTCKVCGKSSLDVSFYAGIKTYCKEHWKEKSRNHRASNIEHYRAYDRRRANDPERIQARNAYSKTDAYVRSHSKSTIKYRENNKHKRKAHQAVNNAVRDGRLIPLPCFVCGLKAEAHHPDYDRPLDVVWLCPSHHRQAHALVETRKAA